MMVLLKKNERNFSGGDSQTLLAVLKNSNFTHSQVLGTQKLRALTLAPITSHLVKLSPSNIYCYDCRNFSQSATLLMSEDEKLKEALRQKRIVTDEIYEPDPAAASGKTTVRILNKEEV